MKKTVFAFCLYYGLFAVGSVIGTMLGLPLQVPMAIAFLLLLYCSTVGRTWMEESKARAGQTVLARKASDDKRQMPRALFVVLLVLPPLLYLILYAVIWSLL